MSDFSKKPEELRLIPVDGVPEGDACEGCYYHCTRTEICQHPGIGLDVCSTPAEEGAREHYVNSIFVEVA